MPSVTDVLNLREGLRVNPIYLFSRSATWTAPTDCRVRVHLCGGGAGGGKAYKGGGAEYGYKDVELTAGRQLSFNIASYGPGGSGSSGGAGYTSSVFGIPGVFLQARGGVLFDQPRPTPETGVNAFDYVISPISDPDYSHSSSGYRYQDRRSNLALLPTDSLADFMRIAEDGLITLYTVLGPYTGDGFHPGFNNGSDGTTAILAGSFGAGGLIGNSSRNGGRGGEGFGAVEILSQ